MRYYVCDVCGTGGRYMENEEASVTQFVVCESCMAAKPTVTDRLISAGILGAVLLAVVLMALAIRADQQECRRAVDDGDRVAANELCLF